MNTSTSSASLPHYSLSAGVKSLPLGTSIDTIRSGLDADSRELLSVLGRTLYVLGLGTVGIIAITGQPPLFFLPLALFLFFGSCLQWRQRSRTTICPEAHQSEDVADTTVRHESFVLYEDKA